MRVEARTINRSKIVEGNAEQIAEAIQAARAKGEVPKRAGVSFAHMGSADHNLGPVIQLFFESF